jgi:hypothetical protein
MPLTFVYAGIDRLIILSQPPAAPTGNRQQEQSPSPRPITKGERLAFPPPGPFPPPLNCGPSR